MRLTLRMDILTNNRLTRKHLGGTNTITYVSAMTVIKNKKFFCNEFTAKYRTSLKMFGKNKHTSLFWWSK